MQNVTIVKLFRQTRIRSPRTSSSQTYISRFDRLTLTGMTGTPERNVARRRARAACARNTMARDRYVSSQCPRTIRIADRRGGTARAENAAEIVADAFVADRIRPASSGPPESVWGIVAMRKSTAFPIFVPFFAGSDLLNDL